MAPAEPQCAACMLGEVSPASARPFCERLEGPSEPLEVVRRLRGEPGAVALSGDWAGGVLILTSHPVRVAGVDEDPFALLEAGAPFAVDDCPDDPPRIGGGWFGWLGFALAGTIELLPPAPPRPEPLPPFQLAFHDHLVRRDAAGDWYFEALWTDARDAVLRERLACWRERLRGKPEPEGLGAAVLRPARPGAAGHAVAVADAIARIAAGELSQVNICMRLDGVLDGDPLDLWLAGVAAAQPAHAAYLAGDGHAIASLSPELFLRRRGRQVETKPIKGTAPRDSDPALLAASGKDRAENLMIVDLMRNDLGRVCEYGSVAATRLCEVEPAAGVWHLVSTVEGTLRPGVGDGRLLEATFPPGSVTGAPKVQALKVIHALEPTAREVFCGAIGFASPLAGLELSVAIRTFEVRGDRIWLGVGGGVVSDSTPFGELEEALTKARGAAAAAGLTVDADAGVARVTPVAPIVELPRPDPALGVFETVGVIDGRARDVDEHLARLAASCRELGLAIPTGLERGVAATAAEVGDGGVRVDVGPGGAGFAVRQAAPGGATVLTPVVLPGGLGPHKWADRRLIDALSAPGATPLLCDLDGEVLEAGYAAVLLVERGTIVAPAIDRRRLDSVSRRRVLAAAGRLELTVVVEPITLERARQADAIVLCSSLRGAHPGLLEGGPTLEASEEICGSLSDVA